MGENPRQLEEVGRLPVAGIDRESLTYRVLTSGRWRLVTDRLIGAVSTVNMWPLSSSNLLANVGRELFVSGDMGRHWESVRRLPDSSGLMGVLPSAVAHHEGITYLGEYPLDTDSTPRILVSHDDGRSWSTLVSLPDVRHVHAVQVDPFSGDLWATTGDTDAESRIGRVHEGSFDVVGSGSQQWRAVELSFTPSAILWGMDCLYADSNRLFKLSRDALDSGQPTPETLHRVPGSVFYSAALDVDGERWVVFSTAMETGRDRTGPESHSPSEARGVVIAASSASGYIDWYELASYRRRRCLADLVPGWLPRANGYVFLEADPEGGVYLNPFNSATADGTIHRISPEWFTRLGKQASEDGPALDEW